MAEKNISPDNLKEVVAKYKGDTKCASCENGKAIGYCIDCGDSLCQECQAVHKRLRSTRNHQMVYFEQQPQMSLTSGGLQHEGEANVPYCAIHSTLITSFCETCDDLVCEQCLAVHVNHDHEKLELTFSKHKKHIINAMEPAKERLDELQRVLKSIDKRRKEIVTQGAEIEASIDSEIEQLEHLLQQLKAKCIGTLKRLTQQKLKHLEEQHKEVEEAQTKLTSCVEETQKKLNNIESVVIRKATLIKRVKHNLATANIDSTQPDEEADLDLYIKDTEKIHQACQDFLEIVEKQSASPRDSYIKGDWVKDATIGEQKNVVFQAMTSQNKEYEGKLNLKAELKHIKSKDRVQCEVVKQQNGQHKINYRPVKRGKHELRLTIDGDPVQGSPFPITVTIATPMKVIPNLGSPRGTAVNSKGQTVVLEASGSCVSVLTPEGEKIRTFGTKGSGNGQLSNTWGVTVDKDDNIYVADNSTHRIQKFSPKGEFVQAVGSGSSGNNQLQFYHPMGIVYNHRDSNLYVADQWNHRIQVLTTDLRFVRAFGTEGTGSEQFQQPYDVAFNSDDKLYVADYNNSCIQVWTHDGRFLRAFSLKANGEKLTNPRCIAIDDSDTVYVAESGTHCVSVFTSEGGYITTFGGEGSEEGQYTYIYGLSIDHNDSIIVSDRDNGRLQIY